MLVKVNGKFMVNKSLFVCKKKIITNKILKWGKFTSKCE